MAAFDAGDAMVAGEAMSGKLWGIGLGPGDPELLTLKAHRLIGQADVVAYPARAGADSLARSIVAAWLKPGVHEIAIEVPMEPARGPAQASYDLGAARIAAMLEGGQDVVVLCEGDPMFYGSFMYLFARLADRFEVEIVPGVTSVSASAAMLGMPLVARNEVLSILPGPMPKAPMRARIRAADAVAIVKVGRHLVKIREVLKELQLTDHAIYIEHATRPGQHFTSLAEAPEVAPYFSMILMTKGNDPWLSNRW